MRILEIRRSEGGAMSGCWGVGSQGDPRLIESMAVTYCYMLCVVCGVWCVYTMQTSLIILFTNFVTIYYFNNSIH